MIERRNNERRIDERRRYVRIPISLKVNYPFKDGAFERIRETVSKNISQGGILISGQHPLSVSEELKLEITGPSLPSPIKTKARIVHVEEIKAGENYEIGLEFIDLPEKDSQFFQQFIQSVDLNRILNLAIKKNASDIHFTSGQTPIFRIFGELIPLPSKPLTSDEIKILIYGFLSKQQIERFEKHLELDTSYSTDLGRFRVNVHKEKGQFGAAFRYITTDIKSAAELGLPPIIESLAMKPNGLILVTGPTGSGKSTTLAAIIDVINRNRKCMIISLEDPIEYLHQPRKSIIKQREIGVDSLSFVDALKSTLRQDVNVILVGEIRDLDSISIALTAAETGHLVLTTLHTTDTIAAINRIIDVFPAAQQQQVRMQLAESLRGVISQILLPRQDKEGRIVATEVMIATTAVANTIRQGTMEQLVSLLQTGSQYGMHTLDKCLEDLYEKRIISQDAFLSYTKNIRKIKD